MNSVLIFDSKSAAERIIPLNQIRKIRIEKMEICLAHTTEGFIAFEKECPHMSDDLSKGKINYQMEVVCPWHTYRFSLNTGQESNQKCKDLKLYKTEWIAGELFVWLP